MNKIVARFVDGHVLKGFTNDFLPARDHFHMALADSTPDARPVDVQVRDLKALFFVRDFAGDPQHAEANAFDAARPAQGRKIRVEFKDGEVLVGTTQGYQPDRPGFFMLPADARSNIERCYVVSTAARAISFV